MMMIWRLSSVVVLLGVDLVLWGRVCMHGRVVLAFFCGWPSKGNHSVHSGCKMVVVVGRHSYILEYYYLVFPFSFLLFLCRWVLLGTFCACMFAYDGSTSVLFLPSSLFCSVGER